MRIEKANFHDVQVIADIEQQTIRSYSNPAQSKWFFENNHIKRGDTYVAIEGNRIVGFLTLLYQPNGPDKGAWIDMLGIKKAYRRQGIGRLLVEQAKQTAKHDGYKILFVGSYKYYRAMYFYLKLGFKIIREGRDGGFAYRDFSIKLA